ncbi:MAG: cysteine hydrolase [Proteobacteria bacterium]|nr:cysteine hydrolase [Pseudomonadota bacterium]
MTDALIVIDMQQGSFGSEAPRHDAAGLVTRLNRLARQIRTDGGAVIFIQHDGPPGDPRHPDEPGWRLLSTLEIKPDDTVVHKTSCDAFLNSTLDAVLRDNGIDRLIITGCATDYSVDTTVRSALGRGWPTIVPSDGHTTVDRPPLSAVQIIARHNAIWADFPAPKGPARVCSCAEVVLST